MDTSRIAFNGPLFGVFQLILVVAIIPGIPKIARRTALPILAWIAHYLITQTTTGDLAADVGLGSAILTQFMTQLDPMFLTDVDTLTDYANPQARKITEQPWKTRVVWAFNLYVNPRGIGWGHEVPNLPFRLPSSTPPSTFVRIKVTEAIICILLECTAYASNASNPGMTSAGVLSEAAFHWRALGVGCFALAGLARMNAMHCLLAACMVGGGWSMPDRWPNLFGSPLEAWSVQRLWSMAWHQMLRKPLIAHASFITTKILRLPSSPSGLVQRLIWLWSLFFVVAIIHIGGEYMVVGRLNLYGGAFKFFMLQPIGILLERTVVFLSTRDQTTKENTMQARSCEETQRSDHQHISKPVERVCPRLWIRCLGYCWAILWFTWSLAFMIDPMVPTGMFADPRVDLRKLL